MDLINDFICHCPLGKRPVVVTCLQKYHAINFRHAQPREYLERLFVIHLHADLFVTSIYILIFVSDSRSTGKRNNTITDTRHIQ